VHEPDIRVRGGGHQAPGDFGVAMRDGDGRLFMDCEDDLRRAIAEIVHDAVVQAAKARSGHERDIGDVESAHDRRDEIAPPDARQMRSGRRRLIGDGSRSWGVVQSRVPPSADVLI
jgi:hypothetical protein